MTRDLELYLTHGEQPVCEVMVPAEEIVALSTDVPVASRDRVASCPGFAHALVVRSRCSPAQYRPRTGA